MKKPFVQNNNNNCICYYRYSSSSQNEQSIDQQREQAELYAEKHGLTIVKEYYDEAISGRDETRPQYNLLLHEVAKIKPAVLILYKTDRLARDKYELVVSRKIIRDAGCAIKCVAEPELDPNDPMSVFIEGSLDAMAEFYSLNLAQNVKRGLHFNARNGLYNGRKLLGYSVDDTKHYVIDDKTAPIVLRIFNQFAGGKGIQQIINELNAQGLKTAYNNKFNINGVRNILRNRAYLGEYRYADTVIPDGMPRLISDELFEEVQRRMDLNKHKSKPLKKVVEDEVLEPRFWLTGKLFCGKCLESMHGVSGTSKTGTIHYYYACKNYRRHKCSLKYVQKDMIEECVIMVLRDFLSDSEYLASLAVDVSEYCKKLYADDSYLRSLEGELKNTEKELANIVNAIKSGCFSKIINDTLNELEVKKESLEQAIDTEKIKMALSYDNNSIQHYYKMYAHADFEDSETRNLIFDYFIDKIYVYDDKLIIDMYFSDDHTEVDLNAFVDMYESVRPENNFLHYIF